MATLLHLSRKSGARAPQRITGINWSSPLAAGLQHARPAFGIGADLLSGETATIVVAGFVYRPHPVLGNVMWCATTSGTARSTIAPISLTAPWSASLWGQRNNTSSAFQVATTYTGGGVKGLRIDQNDGNIGWSYTLNNTSSRALSADRAELITWVQTSTDMVLYVNGEYITQWSNTGDIQIEMLGNYLPSPNFAVDGYFGHFNIWPNRELSAGDVRALYAPGTRWDIYDQGARAYFIPAAAGGGATIIPSLLLRNQLRHALVR